MSANGHRARLRVDDGELYCSLVCPPTGCVPATICGACGRDALGDSETEACYDCPPASGGDPCWLRSWFEELDVRELLHGQAEFEVAISYGWDGEAPVIELGDSASDNYLLLADGHRLCLRVDDGELYCNLLCPPIGCVSATVCAVCGRDALGDSETETCTLCPPASGSAACWLQAVFHDYAPEELLHGQAEFEVAITYEWNGEYPVVDLDQSVGERVMV